MKYRCTNCGYKFVQKSGRVPNKCPYCSSEHIKTAETAQDFINSLEGM